MMPYAPPTPPSALRYADCRLTPAQFARIAQLAHAHAGLRLREGKEGFVRARLARRLAALELADFGTYLTLVEQGGDDGELAGMLDALTTNTTHFLREPAHFDLLRAGILPTHRAPLRIWSAGCATGEEAYSLAMVLAEARPDLATAAGTILATDLSRRALAVADAGRYPADRLAALPEAWRARWWRSGADARGHDRLEAVPSLRRLVRVEHRNLVGAWPDEPPFDLIFCRNVMIYFDKPTQQQLVDRLWGALRSGGRLFVGHSESLTGLAHAFRVVHPAVYQK
jgi:chemotaxis protein methyltransferase CheR